MVVAAVLPDPGLIELVGKANCSDSIDEALPICSPQKTQNLDQFFTL